MNLLPLINNSTASEAVKEQARKYAAVIEKYAPDEPTGIEAKENILALEWGAIKFIFTDKYAVTVTPIFKKGSTSRFNEKIVKQTFFAYSYLRLTKGAKIYQQKMNFATEPMLEQHGSTKVFIYSGEHGAYWRPEGAGYTTNQAEAGVWSLARAWAQTSHCDKTKKIIYEVI